MTGYRIALNFEDGVTRFIDCKQGETVLDAAFRQKINLPMDCSDGVCGTCKCRAESGRYDLGSDYIDEALSESEAAAGQVLTCQMRPESDCVLAVPVAAGRCKTGQQAIAARVLRVAAQGEAAVILELEPAPGQAPDFLPGQYVNIEVPGAGVTRSYSMSTAPGDARLGFLIKSIPGGAMSSWLARATPGEALTLTGPLGSFYLRDSPRPLLFLAGGTGLAPFLSMLEVLAARGDTRPVHLVYGVTRDADLVCLDALAALARRLPGLAVTTVVADAGSSHPRKGWVTQHMPEAMLAAGEVDLYLCGPPPMVEAVRDWLSASGHAPASFHYEKFTPNAAAPAREVA